MAVVGIGQRLGLCLAGPEGSDRDFRIHIGIVFRRRPVQGRERGICRPAGKGDGLPALLMLHGEHGQSGIGFFPPVVLQIHVLSHGEVCSILIVPVPLPGAEVIEITQLVRNGLIKGNLALESQVVPVLFLDFRGPGDFQRVPAGGIYVADKDLRSVPCHQQAFADHVPVAFI